MKYPKPKILLIDMDDDAETFLKKEGYNVVSGSFGTPYKIEKRDGYYPVIRNGRLPFNLNEQEIIVINLALTSILSKPLGDKETPKGKDDWWASRKYGLIDPRVRIIGSIRDNLNTIYSHGGVFIVFSDKRINQEIIIAHLDFYDNLQEKEAVFIDNWSFLGSTHFLDVKDEQGEEITINDGTFNQILSEHIERASYRCTISSEDRYRERFKYNWVSLASNKYGGTVASAIFPTNHNGLILILPQLNDKPHFLAKLFKEVLPDLAPHLFPDVEGSRWTQKPEYEHPKILELKNKIEVLQEEARNQITIIEKDMEQERVAMSFLHELITGTNKGLVKAVKKTIEILGFKKLIDVDDDMEKTGNKGPKREDIQIHDDSPTLLVEVKGISGIPKEAAALQAWKYVAPRMKEWDRTDVQALSIINHQRNFPPLERDNRTCFGDDIITNAKEHGFGLITTWDLFRLTRSFLKNGWELQYVKPLFYQHGRIDIIPTHYEYIGEIEKFWTKVTAVGVKLKASELNVGDRIAFGFPVEFEEQNVESLQVEKEVVSKAEIGNLAGIQTHITKEQARKGIRVFRVKNT